MLGDSCRVVKHVLPFPRVTLWVDPRLWSVDCSAVSAMWKYLYVSTVSSLCFYCIIALEELSFRNPQSCCRLTGGVDMV